MATLTGISPMPLVSDLERSVAYYCERPGLRDVFGDPPDFATAERNEATILLALCEEPPRIVHNRRIVDRIWDAYIRVDDVEGIYAEVQERGARRGDPRGCDVLRLPAARGLRGIRAGRARARRSSTPPRPARRPGRRVRRSS